MESLSLATVYWKDAYSIDEWDDDSEDIHSDMTVLSCGILRVNHPDLVALSLNHDLKNDKYSCTMVIPKKMIIKMELSDYLIEEIE